MKDKRDKLKRSHINEILEFAEKRVKFSRSISLKYRIDDSDIQQKTASGEPVTKLDIIIEQERTEKVRNRYPDHSSIGEERAMKSVTVT